MLDFLEDLPAGVHRVEGSILAATGGGLRLCGVQAVGPNVYVSTAASRETKWDSALVVIGESYDAEAVRTKLEGALRGGGDSGGVQRLRHHLRRHS